VAGSQDYATDPRNDHVLVYVNGDLVARDQAKVSIFDAGFSMGDGVWEGFACTRGGCFFFKPILIACLKGRRPLA